MTKILENSEKSQLTKALRPCYTLFDNLENLLRLSKAIQRNNWIAFFVFLIGNQLEAVKYDLKKGER